MRKRVKDIFGRYGQLLIALVALGLSFGWGALFFPEPDVKAEGERIFRVFETKEKQLRNGMDLIAGRLAQTGKVQELWAGAANLSKEGQDIFYTVSSHDSLVFWSSSLVAFDNGKEQIPPEGRLKQLPTGWFYLFTKQTGHYTVAGYMLIKRDFPYQNRYVHSAFQRDFGLSDQCDVTPDERPGNIPVFCREGKFHFGIQFKEEQHQTAASTREALPATFFFFLFVVLLAAQFARWLAGRQLTPWSKLGFLLLFNGSFYLLLKYVSLPAGIFAGRLFAPFHFAWGWLLASPGDYLLLSLLLFVTAQSFFLFFRKERIATLFSVRHIALHAFAAAYFVFAVRLMLILFDNSDVSPELYNNLTLSLPNILVSGCIALQMIGLGVILLRIRCAVQQDKKGRSYFVPASASLVVLLAFLAVLRIGLPLPAILIFLGIVFLLDRLSLDLVARYKLTFLLVYGMLFAFGLNLVAQGEIEKRKAAIQQVMAVNLASERDPAAEIFLSEFEAKVVKDTLLPKLLNPPYRDFQAYLQENYFNGFWNNYELQVTVCAASDSVFLTDERKRFPCRDFFDQLKVSKGVVIPGSDFYFMDRLNGRISYLGELHLFDRKRNKPLMAFIELNSKIIPEGKGYPQLLLDQQAARKSSDDGYSYAKYFDKKLVDRGGVFVYDPVIPAGIAFDKEFTYFTKGGFSHCAYKRSAGNYVVVSYPVVNWLEKGRGFTPLFLLLYLLGFGWVVVNQRLKYLPKNRLELRGKIQFTLVFTLLALLFLVGLGLVQYNYYEFQRSLKETLDQKVRAISSELGFRLGHVSRLDSIHDYLNDQLVEISAITWTDINLYDLKGRLKASSRNEIFEQGLTSERMNPAAYQALSLQGSATFLHNENLGKMEFFSVYAPLFNRSEQLVGYVNLPYFSRQDEFTRQVTGFIVAFINLYILLVLLTMVIALAISSRLTVPLLQIEQKLKGIALGKQNTPIEYQGEDEIGRLVEAYNKKVAELADSVALLSKSERESAWKEMARQVAHEINNPLTPMKLNIQYLQKIKDEGLPNFDDYFNRVTAMLVTQIDALSTIASAFSDFAKLPSTRIEAVEMVGLVREVVTLFEAPENYQLEVDYPEAPAVFVPGDRDQLRRALVNIIKNAAQAIQNQADGAILVRFEILDQQVRLTISDNGPGIPEADRDRLFEPNFTTKSGGTGLGLAVSKSILENCKGEIRFESEPGKTSFVVNLPLAERPAGA